MICKTGYSSVRPSCHRTPVFYNFLYYYYHMNEELKIYSNNTNTYFIVGIDFLCAKIEPFMAYT